MSELKNILNFAEAYYPTYYITYNILNNQSQDFNWTLISEKPRLLGYSSNENFIPKILNLIFIIHLTMSGNLEIIRNEIKTKLHPRRDKLVCFAQDLIVSKLLKQNWFLQLGMKFVYSLDSQIIWVNPLIWNQGLMTRVDHISNNLWGHPKMGGNLRGHHFKSVGFENPPYYFKSNEFGGKIFLDGSVIRAMEAFGQKYNFTFERHYTGISLGKRHKNGTFEGYQAMMAYPELGYHFGFLAAYHEARYGNLEWPSYGQIIHSSSIVFCVKHGNIVILWYSFLQPFQWPLWMFTIGMFFTLGLIQGLTMYYLESDRHFRYIVWDSATFLPLSLVLEQGLQEIPKGIKIYSMLLLFVTMILGTGYKSTLLTNISFPRKEVVPQTMEELVQSDYQIIFLAPGMEKRFSAANKNFKILEKRMKFIEKANLGQSTREIFLTPEKKVLIFWDTALKSMTSRSLTQKANLPPFLYSKNDLFLIHAGMGITRQSIFANSFILLVYAAQECGLYTKFEKDINYEFIQQARENFAKNGRSKENMRILSKLQNLQNIDDFEREPLTLERVLALLMILPIGELFGLVFFICERIYFKKVYFANREMILQNDKISISKYSKINLNVIDTDDKYFSYNS